MDEAVEILKTIPREEFEKPFSRKCVIVLRCIREFLKRINHERLYYIFSYQWNNTTRRAIFDHTHRCSKYKCDRQNKTTFGEPCDYLLCFHKSDIDDKWYINTKYFYRAINLLTRRQLTSEKLVIQKRIRSPEIKKEPEESYINDEPPPLRRCFRNEQCDYIIIDDIFDDILLNGTSSERSQTQSNPSCSSCE